MAPQPEHSPLPPFDQVSFTALLKEQVRTAVRLALVTVLEEEVTTFIGALPYARSPTRRDRRNGYYTRDLDTTVGPLPDLPVPRTRGGFRTQLFERYARRQHDLDAAISAMFIGGLSTTAVRQVVTDLTGTTPSPSTVSRVFHTLEGEYTAWQQRLLGTRYVYAFADGTYFNVIYDGSSCKMPILLVVGITPAGEREILGFSVGERENQAAWTALLQDLRRRGIQTVDLWITDGGQAMLNTIEEQFAASSRQRCVRHKRANVLGYIPQAQQAGVEPELKAVFYQADRVSAEQAAAAFITKYERTYPTAVACLQRDLTACLTFYDFPPRHWKTIRTNNVVERVFEEAKRRSKKMGAAFRNEDSCVLLFYAVVRSLKFQRLTMSQQPTSETATPAPVPAAYLTHSLTYCRNARNRPLSSRGKRAVR